MKIIIETIPHDQQRYPTVGDWQWKDDGETLTIKVSNMGNWRYEALVAVHELVEVLLCKQAGVSEEKVDQFDINFEARRTEGDDSEPGDDAQAPYRDQHCIATGIERILAVQLDVPWKAYEYALYEL
jgi:hypothetical protein